MTDYRAMCAELLEDLEIQLDELRFNNRLCIRARALLAESVAEAPTDNEIEEWADACSEAPLEEMDPEVHGWRRCFTAKEFSETIRAALARWGRPAIQPVPVSERLPGAKDCNAEGRCWFWHPGHKQDDFIDGWILLDPKWAGSRRDSDDSLIYTHWLPHHAIPTPETND